MAVSLDSYLRSLSSSYYLKNDAMETQRINASVTNLLKNLKSDLGILINRNFIFGSYDRDTILPRKFDKKSDIDIMVVFNHTQYERTPETYRVWLKNFADKHYKDKYGSEVVKTFPTVSIRLNHISYDLVPAKEEKFWTSSILSIPGNNGWRITDPNDVKQSLINANTKYNGVVRPIIRLLKAWNAFVGYPYDSYLLEKEITAMNFYSDNVQTGFFFAVGQLSATFGDPQTKYDALRRLKYNIEETKKASESNDIIRAKHWLHRALPNI